MSTNYYHRAAICAHCGRFDQRHVCKNMRMFRAYRRDEFDPDPGELEIVSWAQWRKLLRAGGELRDEYGRVVDVEEFIAEIDALPPDQRRRPYDASIAYGGRNGEAFLDPEGYSFYDREFS